MVKTHLTNRPLGRVADGLRAGPRRRFAPNLAIRPVVAESLKRSLRQPILSPSQTAVTNFVRRRSHLTTSRKSGLDNTPQQDPVRWGRNGCTCEPHLDDASAPSLAGTRDGIGAWQNRGVLLGHGGVTTFGRSQQCILPVIINRIEVVVRLHGAAII